MSGQHFSVDCPSLSGLTVESGSRGAGSAIPNAAATLSMLVPATPDRGKSSRNRPCRREERVAIIGDRAAASRVTGALCAELLWEMSEVCSDTRPSKQTTDQRTTIGHAVHRVNPAVKPVRVATQRGLSTRGHCIRHARCVC